ncbi:MAG: DUF5407 family protein [Parachlamydiaceae bacterium]
MGDQNSGIDYNALIRTLAEQTNKVQQQLVDMSAKGSSLSITDMFTMQMSMNTLSQLSEMSTSVVSASNSAVASMARNVKS